MKDREEIEQLLISNTSIEELIKRKIEEEFKSEMAKPKQLKKIEIETDFTKVPKELIFSKKAVYKLFNRNTKLQTEINGMQAEALLGLQSAVREKMLSGKQSAFTTDDAYVQFESVTTNV